MQLTLHDVNVSNKTTTPSISFVFVFKTQNYFIFFIFLKNFFVFIDSHGATSSNSIDADDYKKLQRRLKNRFEQYFFIKNNYKRIFNFCFSFSTRHNIDMAINDSQFLATISQYNCFE